MVKYTEGNQAAEQKKADAGNASSAQQPTDGSVIIIPSTPDEATRIDYDLTYYVNDINTANTQVLMTYGRNETEKAVYTYGVQRVAEDDLQAEETSDYLYDGRGSVVQTAIAGEIDLSITYDPFGEITSGVDENFVGYAYNAEETNAVIGLQYLRARYYDTDLGAFITIDSYLGSLTDVASQNRYTYAENDPVNNIDPSGHTSVNANGINQYYQSTGLNELRDFMVGAALWGEEVTAQNAFNGSVARAANTSMFNYQNINGISQATADSHIDAGIARAGQVSMNYGCSVPTVPNQAVAKFESNVNAAKNSANSQISTIKQNKKTQYDEHQEYLRRLEELRKQQATNNSTNNNSNGEVYGPEYPYCLCPYNGTAADFHRLEQNLPPLGCTCGKPKKPNKFDLLTELDKKVNEDLSFIEKYKNVGYYTTEDALNKVLEYDTLISSISNKYGLQKEMIQTILFRELRFYDVRDSIADGFVIETYTYYKMLDDYMEQPWWKQLLRGGPPKTPTRFSEDSSTGLGQIFAKTAITSLNYAIDNNLIAGSKIDYSNIDQRYDIWDKMRTDEEYNIEMIALVLIWSANDIGLSNNYYSYSDSQIQSLLARYNGTNSDAQEYGRESKGWFDIFKKANGGK